MEKVRSADGTEIAYDRAGSGPPVVLVGGATADRQAHAQLAAELAGRFTVYNYDRRGRGDSADAADTAQAPVPRELGDLRALIDVAGGPVFLFGSSSGGILAFQATAAGLPIAKLAMWEPPFAVDAAGVARHRDYKADLRAALEANRPGDMAARFLSQVGTPDEGIQEMRRSPMWPGMEKIGRTVYYDAEAMGDGSIPASRTVPAIVLEGKVAWPTLHDAAVAFAAALGLRHEVIEGEHHRFSDEAMARALGDFFLG